MTNDPDGASPEDRHSSPAESFSTLSPEGQVQGRQDEAEGAVNASGPEKDEELGHQGIRLPNPGFGRRVGDSGHRPTWIISFTDVMALMLTFFVLLYSMSEPEETSWSQISEALQKQLGAFEGPKLFSGPQEGVNLSRIKFNQALNLDYLSSLLDKHFSANETLSSARLLNLEDRLVIVLPGDMIFTSGSEEIGDRGRKILFTIGGLLSRIKNRIEILGHTDPRPVAEGTPYESNWELSLARAASVSAYLRNAGYQRPMIVRGVASSRYQDLPDTVPEEERLKVSRRVEIVIMPDDGRVANLSGMRVR